MKCDGHRRGVTSGWIGSTVAVEVFPSSFVAFEAGAFVEFVRLFAEEVFGDEFDFSDLVLRPAFGGAEDGEEAPVRFVDGLFQVALQVGFPGVRVGGGDEVIDEPEEVGAVAGAHQLLGGLRFRAAEVEWLAAGGIGLAAFAGAQ